MKRDCPYLQQGSNNNQPMLQQGGQGMQVDWHMIAPGPTDPQTKTVDGVEYTYCAKCHAGKGMWTSGVRCHGMNQHIAGFRRQQQQQWQQGQNQNSGQQQTGGLAVTNPTGALEFTGGPSFMLGRPSSE